MQTVVFSFANATSTAWVGFDNYTRLLQSKGFQDTLFNTLLWMAVVPALTVALGLGIAVLADRLNPTWEKTSKTIISCRWRSASSAPARCGA